MFSNVATNTFHFLLKALLFFSFSALVINQYFGKAYTDVVMLVGLIFGLVYSLKNRLYTADEEKLILFGFIAFLLVIPGFFQQTEDTRYLGAVETQLKSLLPLMILPILYYLKITNIKFLVNAIAFAAITAGLITLFFDIPSEMPRYRRTHGSPIIFGDLAMLFGLLSLSFAFYYLKRDKRQFILLIIATVLGITASLYSGSRGGWIALLTVPFIFILHAPSNYRTKIFIISISVIMALIITLLATENPVSQRISSAHIEVQKLLENPSWTGGSLGSRLTFYKISIGAFWSNPIIGIGPGEFYSFKAAIIEMNPEAYSKWIIKYKHSHSEYFSILSGLGLMGIIFYAIFIGWLLSFFKNKTKSTNAQEQMLGITGLALIVCYLDFSLSESFLSSWLGSSAFYLVLTFLFFFISKERQNAC